MQGQCSKNVTRMTCGSCLLEAHSASPQLCCAGFVATLYVARARARLTAGFARCAARFDTVVWSKNAALMHAAELKKSSICATKDDRLSRAASFTRNGSR